MTGEVWAAFGSLSLAFVIAIVGATWKLSSQLSSAITTMTIRDVVRERDIVRLNTAVEKIETAVSAIAVDRANTAALERRVGQLERWYDELRRGIGKIVPHAQTQHDTE